MKKNLNEDIVRNTLVKIKNGEFSATGDVLRKTLFNLIKRTEIKSKLLEIEEVAEEHLFGDVVIAVRSEIGTLAAATSEPEELENDDVHKIWENRNNSQNKSASTQNIKPKTSPESKNIASVKSVILKKEEVKVTKEDILKIAKLEFYHRGFAYTSISRISAEAKIKMNELLNHYKKLEDVWVDCLLVFMSDVSSFGDDPRDTFHSSLEKVMDFMYESRAYFLIIERNPFQSELKIVREKLEEFLASCLKKEKIDGLGLGIEHETFAKVCVESLWMTLRENKESREKIKKEVFDVFDFLV